MTCREFEELLFDYINGNLPDNINKECNNHIENCEKCRNEVALFSEVKEILFTPKKSTNYILLLKKIAIIILIILPILFLLKFNFQFTLTSPLLIKNNKYEIALSTGKIKFIDKSLSKVILKNYANAKFKVVPGNPFLVIANPLKLEVIGTEFEVSLTEKNIMVSVKKGVVKITGPNIAVNLTAGEKLIYSKERKSFNIMQLNQKN